jgi:hypothetical protein
MSATSRHYMQGSHHSTYAITAPILISSYRLSQLRWVNSQRSHIRRREPVDIGTPRCVRLLVSRLTLLPLQHASQFPLLADLRKTTRDKVTGTDDSRLAGTPCASASILLHVAVPVTVRAGVSRFARRGLARHTRSVRSLFGFSRLGLLLFLPLWITQAISLWQTMFQLFPAYLVSGSVRRPEAG